MLKQLPTIIFACLDVFYPLFSRFFSKQTYHYLACGGGNTLLGLIIYYVAYHHLLGRTTLDLGFFAFKPHIAAFFISFLITFPIGFLLSRYVVWSESNLRGRQQLVRHFSFVVFSVFLNYGLLKLFVEWFGWWAMPSQILTTIIIVIFSYLTQKHISFK